jgi:ubiquinone/menaquinone biosynthesis C-methylase UbiE
MKKAKNICCSSDQVKEDVKKHYGNLIKGKKSSCCGPTTIEEGMKGRLAKLAGYGEEERSQVPEEAYISSFGCGNPMAYAEVKSGQVVLDLGSGAGLDVLIASKKVGSKGRVIGLDMTPEMIEKAKENASKAGVKNVEFRLGEMEKMPIENESVDWIISNCVINLSPDKRKVFQEAHRVLKPDGRILVSDMVAEGIPEELKGYLWSSCVGGALDEKSYLRTIQEAGFKEVRIVDRLDYDRETIRGLLDSGCLDLPSEIRRSIDQDGKEWKAKIASIKVSAKKTNES